MLEDEDHWLGFGFWFFRTASAAWKKQGLRSRSEARYSWPRERAVTGRGRGRGQAPEEVVLINDRSMRCFKRGHVSFGARQAGMPT